MIHFELIDECCLQHLNSLRRFAEPKEHETCPNHAFCFFCIIAPALGWVASDADLEEWFRISGEQDNTLLLHTPLYFRNFGRNSTCICIFQTISRCMTWMLVPWVCMIRKHCSSATRNITNMFYARLLLVGAAWLSAIAIGIGCVESVCRLLAQCVPIHNGNWNRVCSARLFLVGAAWLIPQ